MAETRGGGGGVWRPGAPGPRACQTNCWGGRPAAARPSSSGRFAPAAPPPPPRDPSGLPLPLERGQTSGRQRQAAAATWDAPASTAGGRRFQGRCAALEHAPRPKAAGPARAARPPPPRMAGHPPTKKPPSTAVIKTLQKGLTFAHAAPATTCVSIHTCLPQVSVTPCLPAGGRSDNIDTASYRSCEDFPPGYPARSHPPAQSSRCPLCRRPASGLRCPGRCCAGRR